MPLMATMASSGLPMSRTFLCCFNLHVVTFSSVASLSCDVVDAPATSFVAETFKTSLSDEPTTMTFAPFVTPSFRSVISSLARPLIMTFIMAGGMPMSVWRWLFNAPTSLSTGKVTSYFFLLKITLKSTFSASLSSMFESGSHNYCQASVNVAKRS